MKLETVAEILEAGFVTDGAIPDMDIRQAFSADLMSDVLYFSTSDSLLLTALVNSQVIRTAEIAGIRAIVFVSNKKPDRNIIELAAQKKITLLTTHFCSYTASGRLYEAGLPGCVK